MLMKYVKKLLHCAYIELIVTKNTKKNHETSESQHDEERLYIGSISGELVQVFVMKLKTILLMRGLIQNYQQQIFFDRTEISFHLL